MKQFALKTMLKERLSSRVDRFTAIILHVQIDLLL